MMSNCNNLIWFKQVYPTVLHLPHCTPYSYAPHCGEPSSVLKMSHIRLKKINCVSQSCRTRLFFGASLIQQNSSFEFFCLLNFFFQFVMNLLVTIYMKKHDRHNKTLSTTDFFNSCVLSCLLFIHKPSSLFHTETSGSGTTSLAWTYMKVCGYSDSFCKNLNQRSLTPRWPLTPHLQLRSYVWLYPRIIVSKSHENTSKYADTVTFFAKKTWTKGHWPLDDLWPHICWGHMCDSTQGSLCPSPMKIHQSMWIQWTFLLKLEPKVIDP